ncbi:glycosyltransferase family A protein [Lentisphaerota bacterium WC36G]|nr:glycosyltransferase family 2 protein [Lentisphaerae bacterium WC36]
MKAQKNLQKYLQRNKYLHHRLEPQVSDGVKFATCIVIVACAEYDYLGRLLDSLNNVDDIENCAVIVVVNHKHDVDITVKEQNILTLQELANNNKGKFRDFSHYKILLGKNLFYVDAVNNLLTAHAKKFFGVGAARKIGLDLVLNLLEFNGEIEPLLICLDADCVVKKNYLMAIKECFSRNKNIVGGVCDFKHLRSENKLQNLAIDEYEKFMDNYVEGLKFANSPYAFYALGSAIVCTANAYVAVNGMVVKEAGEDFYFLQKLCKLGKLSAIPTTVYPDSRISQRVPFGTGTKIAEIVDNSINGNSSNEEPQIVLQHYNFNVFVELKKIYDAVLIHKENKDLANIANFLSCKIDDKYIKTFFKEQNFSSAWDKIIKNTPLDPQAQERAFNVWFDGFKILKLIHFLEQYQQFKRI